MVQGDTPISELISSPDQVDTTSKESSVTPKKSNMFPIVVGILLLLILGVAGYYVYTQYIVDSEDSVVESNEEEEIGTEEEEITVVESEYEEYVMKNTGWGLFSLPDYEFSAEIPSYTMEEVIESMNIQWNWKASVAIVENDLLPNYLATVFLDFYPEPDSVFNCGGGCAKEHMINVKIYENEGSKSLDEVKTTYFENVKQDGEDNNYIPTITENEEEKWNHNVITYVQSVPADFGEYDGHIVVNSKYIYIIYYYRSETPIESYEVSERVIDSFEFGE